MELFNDIRPYNDAEVSEVLARLSADKHLHSMIAQYNFPVLYKYFGSLVSFLVSMSLKRKFAQIHQVKQFQKIISIYINKIIKNSMDNVTISGIEKLNNEENYTFISNHRDIVLDPAFINYALYENNMETCRIAIGDNLIGLSFVQDLMRLNKSFIVKRSITNRRDKLNELYRLSAYIHNCLETRNSLWLAQSEGRAKDGNDYTDPAIIKMLELSQRRQPDSLNTTIKKLNIIPIAISYEYDPCDYSKANELYQRNKTGDYKKQDNEDMNSIVSGIKGYKGNVHLAFGSKITGDFKSAQEVAAELDKQIHSLYKCYPNNFYAWEMCKNANFYQNTIVDEQVVKKDITGFNKAKYESFMQRVNGCNQDHIPWLLHMYAYPLINRYQLNS